MSMPSQVYVFRPGEVPALISLCQLGPFPQWTLEINIHQTEMGKAICVVGLSDNSSTVFCIDIDSCGDEAQAGLIQVINFVFACL